MIGFMVFFFFFFPQPQMWSPQCTATVYKLFNDFFPLITQTPPPPSYLQLTSLPPSTSAGGKAYRRTFLPVG